MRDSRVERWRGGVGGGMSGCPGFPFVAQNRTPCSVSTSRSSNRTCGFPASGSPTGFANQHTGRSALSFAGSHSSFRGRRIFDGGSRQHGHSPDSWSLPQRTRSQAPSLHRRYPASTVLWACPTPQAARPVPRGRPVGACDHRLGSPVLRAISLCQTCRRHYPGGITGEGESFPE